VATGESMRDSDRDYIEKTLRADLFLTYATWEVKWIAHECTERRYHINEEYVYVEIVDDAGQPLLPEQEGRIVVTSFDSESMPFVRYALGDRGKISEEFCPCGRTSRTISVLGRQTDIIEMPGRLVPLFDVSTSFDTFASAVQQYRIVQKAPLTFFIQIVAGPMWSETMKKALDERLASMLHPEASIEFEVVTEIQQAESGKAAYFSRAY
jgi:phenylacetate-CoA ligase